ncbi:unnamed protein product [Heligmosomoides polygyrus]|uniref:Uncharacterized protein n=1 Tax=Heligmosomoides polygyrus TaxID=6339 RepID=A0A183F732_HELPZ|nr:unnamed protein product [Heligmosomoides polygyrus]
MQTTRKAGHYGMRSVYEKSLTEEPDCSPGAGLVVSLLGVEWKTSNAVKNGARHVAGKDTSSGAGGFGNRCAQKRLGSGTGMGVGSR